MVARQLRLNWSPEQIAGWLQRAYRGQEAYQVSHETIYRSLFVQTRGVLKKELVLHLRSKRTIRRSRQANQKGDGRGQIKDIISIRERPASVEDRAVPGRLRGRSAVGIEEQLHRDPGGTSYAICDAGEGGQ
jgi:IS30 family transposase